MGDVLRIRMSSDGQIYIYLTPPSLQDRVEATEQGVHEFSDRNKLELREVHCQDMAFILDLHRLVNTVYQQHCLLHVVWILVSALLLGTPYLG